MDDTPQQPASDGFWPLVICLLPGVAAMPVGAYLLFFIGLVAAAVFSALAAIVVGRLWIASEPETPVTPFRRIAATTNAFALIAGAPSGLMLYLCSSGMTGQRGACFASLGTGQMLLGVVALAAFGAIGWLDRRQRARTAAALKPKRRRR